MNRTDAVRNLLLGVLAVLSFAAVPAAAQISFNISIAPPAPQYEVVPVIAPGYVWAPGYWGWTGDRHIWIRGRSIVQREGYRWEPDRWEQRDRAYYRQQGRWVRDAGYRVVKVKNAKKPKHRDNDEHGRGNAGKRGKGS